MPTPPPLASTWNTSSAGQPADISLLELGSLGDHLALCGALRGPLDNLLAGAAWLQALWAQRVISVALVVILLAYAVSLAR